MDETQRPLANWHIVRLTATLSIILGMVIIRHHPDFFERLFSGPSATSNASVSTSRPADNFNAQMEGLIDHSSGAGGGVGFFCQPTPVYQFPPSVNPPGGPTWMNKKPARIARAGTEIYKVEVFGADESPIHGDTQFTFSPGSNYSYFVNNSQIQNNCP